MSVVTRIALMVALAGCAKERLSGPTPVPTPAPHAMATVTATATATANATATSAPTSISGDALQGAVRRTTLHGFVAATVVHHDGKSERVKLTVPKPRSEGAADARAVPVASFTKFWTSVVAMRLVAQHRIELSARIADVLPTLASRPWSDSTLFELLTHTSRVPEFDEAGGYFSRADVDFTRAVAMLEKHVPRTWTEKRGVFKYRNAEYAIVGAMLAARGDAPFPELMARELFGPAKMAHAGLLVGAVPADVDARSLGSVRGQNFFAAGAGYATADDLLAFFEALAGDALLDEASKRTLFDGAKERGYGALGCWAYSFSVAASDGGVTHTNLVERQGALGNMVLFTAFAPEQRRAVVAWSSEPTEFSHPYLRKGTGFSLATALLGPSAGESP